MNADTQSSIGKPGVQTLTEYLMTAPAKMQRTPEEKARILARLTLGLAATGNEERRVNGDA
jgi:hypothetical protein